MGEKDLQSVTAYASLYNGQPADTGIKCHSVGVASSMPSIPETSSSCSSILIKEALKKDLIKAFDPNTVPRYMKYIPVWA